MPLPTARHTVPNVGSTRGQGSGADACPHPQIGRLLWRGQPEHRQIRARPVPDTTTPYYWRHCSANIAGFSRCSFYRHTVPNWHPSSAFGNWLAAWRPIIASSQPCTNSLQRSSNASIAGEHRIQCYVDYAALFKTVCLDFLLT